VWRRSASRRAAELQYVAREHPKLPLIKALARSRGWYEKVVHGKAFDMRSLSRDAGLTERYVGKVFRSAFLAPDIVEAILAGRQPHDLNFDKLCQNLPLSWVEQRAQLGFSPLNTCRPRPSLVQYEPPVS
jgi:site-specific DNA recombinase